MKQQIGAMIEWLEQVRGGKGGIDHQRQFVLMRDGGHFGDVQHIEPRVAEGFGEQDLGIRTYGLAPGGKVTRLHKGGVDAKAFQGVMQQIMRAAVKGRRGNNMRARSGDGGKPQMQCRLPAGGGDGGDATF